MVGNWDPPRLPQVSCRCCSLCPQGHLCPPGDAAPGCLAAGRGGRWKPVLSPSPCRGLPPPTSHFRLPVYSVSRGRMLSPLPEGSPPAGGGTAQDLEKPEEPGGAAACPAPSLRRWGWGFAGRSSSCFSSPLPSRLEGRGRGLDGSSDLRPGDLLCKARVSLLRWGAGGSGVGKTPPGCQRALSPETGQVGNTAEVRVSVRRGVRGCLLKTSGLQIACGFNLWF